MERKIGCCPKCLFEDHHNKFFEVNEELNELTCPICEATISPKESIKTFEKFVYQMQRHADSLLFDYCDGYKALENYADMIDDAYYLASYNRKNAKDDLLEYVDPIYLDAFFGRILSIVFISNAKRAKIKQAGELLDSEKEYFYRNSVSDNTKFLVFVKRLVELLNNYFAKLDEVLMKKNIFKNVYGCYLKLLRVNEAKGLMEKVLEMLETVGVQTEVEDLKDIKEICLKKKDELDGYLELGKSYFYGKNDRIVFYSFDNSGFPVLRTDAYQSVNHEAIKISFEEKISHFNEVMFKNRSIPLLLYRLSPVLLFFNISFVCITAYSVYIYRGTPIHKWASMIVCSVFIFITFLCVLQGCLVRLHLKKRSKKFLFKSALIRYKN